MVRRAARGRKVLWISLAVSLGIHMLAARLGLMPSVFSVFSHVGEGIHDLRDDGIRVLSIASPSPPAVSPELPPEITADAIGEELAVEFELAPAGLDPGDGSGRPGAVSGSSSLPPVPRTVPWLKYPPAALEDGVSGTVVLHLLIGSDGRVVEVEVVKELRFDCDRAAVEAARGMVFEPARAGGRAVRAWTEYEISFDPGEP
ncbi:MAG: TonB family protein [Candidatus Eisenbacteria sp.]|nr:TonB family protein [Candidatus Eisenbacteria bacterium]